MGISTAPELPQLTRIESLATQAHQVIREGIATGEFAAGERVTERALASRLNVSPTPIREALRRLEQEGLVERLGPRQLRVVDHSFATLRELMFIEVVLRSTEARFATDKISDAALARMERIVETMASEHDIDDAEQLLKIARKFDVEIERAADNTALRNLILSVSIFGQGRRLRSIDALKRKPEMGEQRLQDHRDMLEAFRSRDPDAVEQVVRRHATSVMNFLITEVQ